MKETTIELTLPELPHWETLDPKAMLFELPKKLNELRQSIEALCIEALADQAFSWHTFHTIQEMLQNVNDWWSPLTELYSVNNSPLIRQVMEEAQSEWIDFYSWLSHYPILYDAAKNLLAHSKETLSPLAQRSLTFYLLDCEQQGIHLAKHEQTVLKSDQLELANVELSFENNLSDANAAGALWLAPEESLDGLPETLKMYAKEQAEKEGKTGYKFALDDATVPLVLAFACDRHLRKRMHRAYCTRASDQAEGDLKKFDNAPNIEKILKLRQKIAQQLGYENFASLRLERRLLKTPQKVWNFLTELTTQVGTRASQENEALERFALALGDIEKLEPWDRAYYARLMKQERYQIDLEQIRQYFPLSSVLNGLFALIQELFNVSFVLNASVKGWDPATLFYEVIDCQSNQLWGGLFLDLFARPHKHSGAWVSEIYNVRQRSSRQCTRPIGALHTNFMPPSDGKEPLLTHLEVVTLFHEMGHALQLLLTTVTEPQFSGLSSIPLDALEIASQWMEEWAWDPQVLRALSCHVVTRESIDDQNISALIESRAHHAAGDLIRQASFSCFDMRLHEISPGIQAWEMFVQWKKIRGALLPDEEAAYARFPMTFSHIFSSSYAAGYYSYLWSEVLAMDLFLSIQEVSHDSDLKAHRLQALKDSLFAQGGSVDTQEQFKHYRGRDPEIFGVLKRRGLVEKE